MYTLIGSAIVGALLASRGRPKTRCKKKQMLGSKSGATYTVEDFETAGFIVVTAVDGSQGVFQRRAASPGGGRGFEWQHGRGRPATLAVIYEDLMGEKPKPRAVPSESGAGEARATTGKAAPKSRQATRGTP